MGPRPAFEQLLTTVEVAHLLEMAPATIRRWVDSGRLPATKTLGKHRRVAPAELLAFLNNNRMPVPASLERGLRVLIIDDQAGFLAAMKTLLKRADSSLHVDVVDSGIDGLLRVGAEHPDVVLLDAYMDDFDGFAVCRRIKALPTTSGTMVVGISGRPDAEEKFLRAGADGFLLKPLSAEAVLVKVATLGLAGRRVR